MKYLYLLIFMMTSAVLMAANPVGRVTSSGALTLNGKAVPATAVSSLPVVAGDEIVTARSSAMIYFADKSRATIAPNSRVRLEGNESSVALRVLSGSVDLQRAQGSGITVIEPTHPATPTAGGHRAMAQKPDPPPRRPPPPPPPPPRSQHCPPSDPHCD